MGTARAERVAGPPKLPEPISGHSDGTKVTRIQGPSAGAMADKVDPFVHLPVTGAPDPKKQKDMIGSGGVTRQTGVLHQDSQGSLRVDIPVGGIDTSAVVASDRRPTVDEDQVSIVDPSQIHRPIVQGGTEKVGIVGFKGDAQYQAWLDKVKAGDAGADGNVASIMADRRAPGVQMPDIPATAQQVLPDDHRAAIQAGVPYRSDVAAAPGAPAVPVRYSDLHDPKAGRAQAKAAEQAHADADRVIAGSRQRKAAPRRPKRRTASARSRQRSAARPAQPSATGGAPEDAEREKEGE